jgi:hypothetical protein
MVYSAHCTILTDYVSATQREAHRRSTSNTGIHKLSILDVCVTFVHINRFLVLTNEYVLRAVQYTIAGDREILSGRHCSLHQVLYMELDIFFLAV